MKVVHISDTHNHSLDEIDIPEGEVLIHSGDGTSGSVSSTQKLANELRRQPHNIKIYVPGNHDWLFQKKESLSRDIFKDIIVLIDQEHVIDGIRFYGSPRTPQFYNWAFMHDRGADIKRYWDLIPGLTDVLITHGPPKEILDGCPNFSDRSKTFHAGCEDLRDAIDEVKPKYHLFGHIHSGYGIEKVKYVTHINSSILDNNYLPRNQPNSFIIT